MIRRDPGRDAHVLLSERVEKSEGAWLEQLGTERYRVLRRRGTEPAYSGVYVDTKAPGIYRCAGCGTPLFSSEDKFDSGTGWPSFTRPAEAGSVEVRRDFSLILPRREVTCSSCGSHLGHVFRDGPPPTGERYCINSCALDLERTGKGG